MPGVPQERGKPHRPEGEKRQPGTPFYLYHKNTPEELELVGKTQFPSYVQWSIAKALQIHRGLPPEDPWSKIVDDALSEALILYREMGTTDEQLQPANILADTISKRMQEDKTLWYTFGERFSASKPQQEPRRRGRKPKQPPAGK